ncbi:uncharacterized protein KQ657_004446 [Scheffersomyces spartinae]|uniref:3-methyl-2-oxobutanoate hydroxymethyltransferase n=1 Tax=Scheffersomyces spartinae TaxID=45513 RepID=A0A9P7VC26_9ASCO|nr:uncharacterized protein KQ657_004446 [Scheffersomyces spartinae]KAG7194766.1 hypothetical protein KQ657_004446 [Scheffersomyces spartinae]
MWTKVRGLGLMLIGRRFSSHKTQSRKTLVDIHKLYGNKTPILMVTSYDYITGKYAASAGVDINLIGDSLAMTCLGYEDTNQLPFEEFLYHVKAVERGDKQSFIVADLPFGTYEASPEKALETSVQLIKEGRIQAVKLEGGHPSMISNISKIIDSGIPVMGHVGLTPQRHNVLGGFKLQGTDTNRALQIYEECVLLQKAGCFAIVLECIPNRLAEYITSKLSIPTIGIGAGPHCSGQVLVMADLLGMLDDESHPPAKFVKKYASFSSEAVKAIQQYRSDLKGVFPQEDIHGYKMKRDALLEFKRQVDDRS